MKQAVTIFEGRFLSDCRLTERLDSGTEDFKNCYSSNQKILEILSIMCRSQTDISEWFFLR